MVIFCYPAQSSQPLAGHGICTINSRCSRSEDIGVAVHLQKECVMKTLSRLLLLVVTCLSMFSVSANAAPSTTTDLHVASTPSSSDNATSVVVSDVKPIMVKFDQGVYTVQARLDFPDAISWVGKKPTKAGTYAVCMSGLSLETGDPQGEKIGSKAYQFTVPAVGPKRFELIVRERNSDGSLGDVLGYAWPHEKAAGFKRSSGKQGYQYDFAPTGVAQPVTDRFIE